MAQNQFINASVDPAASKKPDNADHRHTVAQSGSASGDLSVTWDSAKVTSLSLWDSTVAAIRKVVAGQLK